MLAGKDWKDFQSCFLIYFHLFSVNHVSWFLIERARRQILKHNKKSDDFHASRRDWAKSCEQIFGLESEILWEAHSKPTLDAFIKKVKGKEGRGG
jgi:hypothetical protein